MKIQQVVGLISFISSVGLSFAESCDFNTSEKEALLEFEELRNITDSFEKLKSEYVRSNISV